MKSLILKEVNRFTVAFILLYGIYVILHGHLSPGGGFAGGTVISAGMILYKFVHPEKSKDVFSFDFIKNVICGALVVYGLTKGYHILTGIYGIGHGEHVKHSVYSIANGGTIVLLNVCVGLIVASTFYTLVCLFLDGEMK